MLIRLTVEVKVLLLRQQFLSILRFKQKSSSFFLLLTNSLLSTLCRYKTDSLSLRFVIKAESFKEPLLVVFLEAGVRPVHEVLAHVGGVFAGGRSTVVSFRQHAHEVRTVAATEPRVLHAQRTTCTCKFGDLRPAAQVSWQVVWERPFPCNSMS